MIHRYLTIWMDEHYLQGKIRSGEVYLSNTNRLIKFYPGCDGVKTGFTREAGNSISATAKRGTSRFLAVVMDSPNVEDRYEAAVGLLDHGFNHYKSVPVTEKGAPVAVLPVDKGCPSQVEIVARHKLSLFMARGEEEEYRQEIRLPAELKAPVKKNQVVGAMIVKYGQGQEVPAGSDCREEARCSLLTASSVCCASGGGR